MNRKYVLHPGDYAIGENEKLYGDMSAKGWLLDKRGAHLSRFRKAAPVLLRYRIEPSSPDILNGHELPDEQLALYEECGWSYVTGRVWIHVFSAPEDSDAPEFYTDPRQQAATLKGLRRRYYFSWIRIVVILMINSLLPAIYYFRAGNVFEHVINIYRLGWFTYTALFLLFSFVVLWAVYATLHGAVCIAQLHRVLKHGQPIDHVPKKRNHLHRVVNSIMLTCCAACVVLLIMQWAQNKKYVMPKEADGPYLLLKDLGWDGERTQMFTDLTSFVETKHSLLSNQWYTYESVSTDHRRSWMYQDVYELRENALARDLIPLLMVDSIFTRNISGFTRVDVAGLDEAYKSDMEYISLKGTTVYHITYSDPDVYTEKGTQIDVLVKLAEMLK